MKKSRLWPYLLTLFALFPGLMFGDAAAKKILIVCLKMDNERDSFRQVTCFLNDSGECKVKISEKAEQKIKLSNSEISQIFSSVENICSKFGESNFETKTINGRISGDSFVYVSNVEPIKHWSWYSEKSQPIPKDLSNYLHTLVNRLMSLVK